MQYSNKKFEEIAEKYKIGPFEFEDKRDKDIFTKLEPDEEVIIDDKFDLEVDDTLDENNDNEIQVEDDQEEVKLNFGEQEQELHTQ